MPIWVQHGDKDTDVNISCSDKMVEALRRHGSDVKYTVWEGRDHHIYFDIYKDDELYEWLLSHRRRPFHTETETPERAALEPYLGRYRNDQSWDMTLDLSDEGKLQIGNGQPLGFSTDHVFFFDPYFPGHFSFRPDPETGRMQIFYRMPNQDTVILTREEE